MRVKTIFVIRSKHLSLSSSKPSQIFAFSNVYVETSGAV